MSTPVMIFKIVDLPEPFVPIIPTVSPFYLERQPLKGIEITMIIFMGNTHRFLQPVNRLIIQPVDLCYILNADGIFLSLFIY